MNRVFRLLMILLAATAVFACNDDEETGSVGSKQETLNVNEADKSLSFDMAGGSRVISVTASALFTLEAIGGDWLTVSEIASIADTTSFRINVVENPGIETRSGKLALSIKGSASVDIEVLQDGATALTASRQSLKFNSGENETTVTVNAKEYTATVSNGAEWLSTSVSGSELRVWTARNASKSDRTGAILIHVDGLQDLMIRVTQTTYAPPSISPTSLDFTYIGSEKIVTVNSDQSPYTATVNFDPQNKDGEWLTATVSDAGLRIKVSDNYKLYRTAVVTVHVEGPEGVSNIILSVSQGAMPEGGTEMRADRTGWTATARGNILSGWGSDGYFNGTLIRGGNAQLVLDGNVYTGWHTYIGTSEVPADTVKGTPAVPATPASPLPQCMVVDMKSPRIVTAIEINHLPGENGYFQTIQIYLSESAIAPDIYRPIWGAIRADYTWTGGMPFRIDMTPSRGRYLILYFPNSSSEGGKSTYISFTELDVYVKEAILE
jgi:hypothetical protein